MTAGLPQHRPILGTQYTGLWDHDWTRRSECGSHRCTVVSARTHLQVTCYGSAMLPICDLARSRPTIARVSSSHLRGAVPYQPGPGRRGSTALTPPRVARHPTTAHLPAGVVFLAIASAPPRPRGRQPAPVPGARPDPRHRLALGKRASPTCRHPAPRQTDKCTPPAPAPWQRIQVPPSWHSARASCYLLRVTCYFPSATRG